MEAVDIDEKTTDSVDTNKPKRRPISRPPTPAQKGRNRDKIVKVRAYEEELDDWLKKANAAGFGSVPRFVRQLLFDFRVTPRVFSKVDPELIRHVSWIGNNLNQLAKRVNQSDLDPNLAIDVLAALMSVERNLRALIDENK